MQYDDACCYSGIEGKSSNWKKITKVVFEKELYRLSISYIDNWEFKIYAIEEEDKISTHVDGILVENPIG